MIDLVDVQMSHRVISCVIRQENGDNLRSWRRKESNGTYSYYIEDEEMNDINITDIVSEEVKSAFATIYHERVPT